MADEEELTYEQQDRIIESGLEKWRKKMRMKKGLLHSEFFDLEYIVNLCKKERNY